MKAFITLLILAALAGLLVWQYNMQYQALEKIHAHRQAAAASAPQENPAQQQCGAEALARFKVLGLENKKTANYRGHFSASQNQCYSLIENNDVSTDTTWKRITLYDANGRVYGTYEWHNEPGQKASDVPPFTCTVNLPNGEESTCSSEDGFRDLVATYMK